MATFLQEGESKKLHLPSKNYFDQQKTVQKFFIPGLHLPVSKCSKEELMYFICESRIKEKKVLIDHLNIDNLLYSWKNVEYWHILSHLSSVNLIDGMPLSYLAALSGIERPQRLALTDVFPAMMELAALNQYTVFILGSNPSTLNMAKKVLYQKNMMPHTVACWSEPRKKLEDAEVNRDVLRLINQVKPDLLFVALGAPWQTIWVGRNWNDLPNCTVVPIGGALDYLGGIVGRAPLWMQKIGMEWLYRLLFDRQPRERSLFKRYIIDDIPFLLKLVVEIKRNQNNKVYQNMEKLTY